MALSNILNAGGRKVTASNTSTDGPAVLLEVNQAVNRTVANAGFLEQVLYQKLDLIQEICEPCKTEDTCGPLDPGPEDVFCE